MKTIPRGRLVKTKAKEAKEIAMAIRKGQNKAEKDKDWEVSLKEHVGRMLDRIDPVETIAVFGATILIRNVINAVPELLGRVQKLAEAPTSNINPDLIKTLSDIFGGWFFPSPKLTETGGTGVSIKETVGGIIPSGMAGDITLWIISFALAFFLIRNGAQILSGVGSLTTWLLAFIPVVGA